MAECACASLIFTSFIDVPSLVCVDPNYLNWSTSNTFSFIHILVDGLTLCWWRRFCFRRSLFPCRNQQLFSPAFQWVGAVLLHCLLTDRCRQQTASCKAVVLRWTLTTVRCQLLLHLIPNCLQIGHPLIAAEVSKSSAYFSKKYIKSTRNNGHTCRTPIVVRKKSPTLPFSNTALVTSSYNDLMTSTNQLSMLYSFKSRQRPSCGVHAFLKSMKLSKSPLWCSNFFSTNTVRLNICSVVLLYDLQPAVSSSKIRSAWLTSLLRITRDMTLLGWLIGPFFGRGIINDCVQSSGHCPLGIGPNFPVKASATPGPQYFRISDIVDTRWFTILQHPCCFLYLFFKYYLSYFSVFFLSGLRSSGYYSVSF